MKRAPLALWIWLSTAAAAFAASSAHVTAVEPAEVFLDGEPIGSTPLHIARLDPGTHQIQVRATTTRRTQQFTLQIPSGVSVDRDFHADFSTGLALTPPAVGPLAVSPLAPAPVTISPLRVAPVAVTVASVNVETDVTSQVLLDGHPVGQGSLRLTGVTPGVHVVEVVDTRTGAVMAQHLSIPEGASTDVTVPLRFHPTITTLVVPTVVVRPFPPRPRYSRWPAPVINPTLVIGSGHRHRRHRFGRF
jgi:hypothetical protein